MHKINQQEEKIAEPDFNIAIKTVNLDDIYYIDFYPTLAIFLLYILRCFLLLKRGLRKQCKYYLQFLNFKQCTSGDTELLIRAHSQHKSWREHIHTFQTNPILIQNTKYQAVSYLQYSPENSFLETHGYFLINIILSMVSKKLAQLFKRQTVHLVSKLGTNVYFCYLNLI